MMKVVSFQISPPEEIQWRGQVIRTSIFKKNVSGPVRLTQLGFEGDGQADLEHHGGELKAVYAYGADEYPAWRKILNRADLPYGVFGENLTIEGLDESEVALGDLLRVGTAVLEAIQPRQPCSKLNVRLDDPQMVRKFWDRKRWGIYFRVHKEGIVRNGDACQWIHKTTKRFPVPLLMDVLKLPNPKKEDIEFVLSLEGFPEALKDKARKRLTQGSV